MKYDFETCHQCTGLGCEKYDRAKEIFGTDQVIPLWVADMDFAAPSYVTRALVERVELPVYGYAQRMPAWAEAVGGWLDRRHGWVVEEAALLPTVGVVPSLALAIQTFTDPGDGVIIQPPVYFPFFSVVRNNNRQLLLNPLRQTDGYYRMDFEQLEQLAPKASMLLLCNPHNPGGRAWTPEELATLADICTRHRVMVVSDEIHMDLTYAGYRHTPFALVAGDTRFMSVTSAGKTFNTAGIGGGYAVIPDPVIVRPFITASRRCT